MTNASLPNRFLVLSPVTSPCKMATTSTPATGQDSLACLDRALKAPSRHHQRQQEEYLQRLGSFHATTYFAKPVSLSPLVCARFGWKNVDKDLLCCDKCQAVMAITYMRGLSSFATQKLTRRYEQQLGEKHKENCLFRRDAMTYFEQEDAEKAQDDSAMIVPFLFASYLPVDLLELMETKRPAIILGKQLQERLKGNISWETICLETHASLAQYKPPTNSSADTDDSETLLADCLLDVLSKAGHNFKETASKRARNTALILLLLGWTPGECSKDSISLTCGLCQTTATVERRENGAIPDDTTEPQPKRPRRASWDPLYAHRHYCPFVCGFPRHGAARGTALWKALADKVITTTMLAVENETNLPNLEGKSQWVQVNALLNAAIVRTKMLVGSKE